MILDPQIQGDMFEFPYQKFRYKQQTKEQELFQWVIHRIFFEL